MLELLHIDSHTLMDPKSCVFSICYPFAIHENHPFHPLDLLYPVALHEIIMPFVDWICFFLLLSVKLCCFSSFGFAVSYLHHSRLLATNEM